MMNFEPYYETIRPGTSICAVGKRMRLFVGAVLLCLVWTSSYFYWFSGPPRDQQIVSRNEDSTQYISRWSPSSSFASSSASSSASHSIALEPNTTLAAGNLCLGSCAYNRVLAARSKDKVVMLTMIDSGFIDMALNFYETSISKFQIDNYLFIGATKEACLALEQRHIHCYVYMEEKAKSAAASSYGHSDFNKKMNIRTYMILDALQLGYSVLHTDVDVVFFKNPYPYLTCPTCDVQILWDAIVYNAGFVYLRPTRPAIRIYHLMKLMSFTSPGLDDQSAMNKAIAQVFDERSLGLQLLKLDPKQFLCGQYYFEEAKRFFAGTKSMACAECVMVHNNWIVSKAAKIYRFKETHLWVYDATGYYSNPNRKYLTYRNVLKINNQWQSIDQEKASLANALAIGKLLNRTVILPTFHCAKDIMCPLNSHFRVSKFDQIFGKNYREHTFLSHPKVPAEVRESQSPVFLIETDFTHKFVPVGKTGSVAEVFSPTNTKLGARAAEIVEWFSQRKEAVLQFHSLYQAFWKFNTPKENADFEEMVAKAFSFASYRQYEGSY